MAGAAPRIITANWGNDEVVGIDGYMAAGGYEGLRSALDMTPEIGRAHV